ncbi:hypothetical protein AB0I72_19935 [Nocardiopsis sp. NPDC049922]|uniref:hypothetical protein n=1 Tax=Nocardiopsis sp. NPDC049922 TaxID=3155157 RepID=UPI0033DF33E7
MATRHERDALTRLAIDAWHNIDEILTARGETNETTTITDWEPGLQTAWAELTGIRRALTAVDLYSEITDIRGWHHHAHRGDSRCAPADRDRR